MLCWGGVMFRALYESIHIVGWVFTALILICIFAYFLIGVIIKKYGIYMKLLLIGEEYVFSLISSILIFLTLSFLMALTIWLIVFFLMNCFFRKNQRIINCIVYCEQHKNTFTERQLRLMLQLNPCLKSAGLILWIKDFRRLRREVLYKIDNNIYINLSKFKYKPLPFSVFGLSTIGIFGAFLTYGHLIENTNSFMMLLLENYSILSCVLFVLYWLLYFSMVNNIFHYMYGYKKLFKVIFFVFSVIMYVCVTVISMNT